MGRMITLLIFGGIISVLGILNITGKIVSIRWYNRQRVSEDDLPKYGKCIGTGSLIVGVSFMIFGIFETTFQSAIFEYVILFGCLVGVIVMLYGRFKYYNKGIF